MSIRSEWDQTHRLARNAAGSRATVREYDDKHLIQEVKYADVFHSETPSQFERFQPVGLTAVPLKQEQKKQQGQSSQKSNGGSGSGDYQGNDDQPKGKASEMLMNYLNGSRSHPVGGLTDDRRVRPYAMKEGESAMYAASGTGQMLFHNANGSYLVVTNNPAEQSDGKDVERQAFVGHVKKKKQPREIKENQQIEDPHHEGETINTGVRCTSGRIEFVVGGDVVGYYDKEAKRWSLIGDVVRLGSDDASHPVLGDTGTVSKVSAKVYVKAENDAHPTSLDTEP